MLEQILGLTTGATLTDLGVLAAITTVVVQVLKQVLPKSFPTKALTIITGIIISLTAALICYGFALKSIGIGIIIGFITAFVAMNGFDSLRDIWSRFTIKEEDSGGEG